MINTEQQWHRAPYRYRTTSRLKEEIHLQIYICDCTIWSFTVHQSFWDRSYLVTMNTGLKKLLYLQILYNLLNNLILKLCNSFQKLQSLFLVFNLAMNRLVLNCLEWLELLWFIWLWRKKKWWIKSTALIFILQVRSLKKS